MALPEAATQPAQRLARGAELERFAGLEPEAVQAERAELWEERLLVLAKLAKIDLGRLPAKKSHRDKVKLAAALKQSTSVPNAWLADRLGMGQPASASQFVRRYLLQEENHNATAALLSESRPDVFCLLIWRKFREFAEKGNELCSRA